MTNLAQDKALNPNTIPGVLRLFFSRPAPFIPVLLFLGASIYRIYQGGLGRLDIWTSLGVVLIWPVWEWMIHVHLLHFKPIQIGAITIDPKIGQKHRAHHRDPFNLDDIMIPLRGFAYGIPLVSGLCYFLLPQPQAITALATIALLTVHYEWVHFLVHTRYKPKTAYYEKLWRNHRLHHCKNENYWQGVTMLAGDILFATNKEPTEVHTSPTCRDLGVKA